MKKYIEVQRSILEKIKTGTLKPGDKLPGRSLLCAEYGVAPVTICRAIDELIEQEVLYAVQGKGTFVSEKRVQWRTISDSFFKNIANNTNNITIDIKRLEKIKDRRIAKIFKAAPATEFTYFERVRMKDGEPVAVSVSYLPLSIISENDYYYLRRCQSLYKMLAGKKIIPTSTRETFTVEIASRKSIYTLLLQSNNTPLLVTKRLNYDDTGRIFEYTENYLLPHRYEIVCWHSSVPLGDKKALKRLDAEI